VSLGLGGTVSGIMITSHVGQSKHRVLRLDAILKKDRLSI